MSLKKAIQDSTQAPSSQTMMKEAKKKVSFKEVQVGHKDIYSEEENRSTLPLSLRLDRETIMRFMRLVDTIQHNGKPKITQRGVFRYAVDNLISVLEGEGYELMPLSDDTVKSIYNRSTNIRKGKKAAKINRGELVEVDHPTPEQTKVQKKKFIEEKFKDY